MSQVDGSGQGTTPAGAGESVGEGAAPGASFLGGEDAGGDGSPEDLKDAPAPKDGADGEKADTAEAAVPARPEDYKLNFAEDIPVDKALLQGFKAEAHQLGISQGQAQKLADFYAKRMGESARASDEAHIKAILEAEKGWIAEIEARPGFRRELADARRALKEFGGDGFTEIMNQTRLGSHPVFFDFVAKVGRALAEPEARGRGAGGPDSRDVTPLADRLWPGMK